MVQQVPHAYEEDTFTMNYYGLNDIRRGSASLAQHGLSR